MELFSPGINTKMSDCSWEAVAQRYSDCATSQAALSTFPADETRKVKVPKSNSVKMQFTEAGGIHLPKERVRRKSELRVGIPPSLAIGDTR